MSFLPAFINNAELDTEYTSDTVIAESVETVTAVNGILIINGIPSGSTYTVAIDDSVAVRLQSSAANSTPTYASFSLNGIRYTCLVITKPDTRPVYDRRYQYLPPYSRIADQTWVPEQDNRVVQLSLSSYVQTTWSINQNAPTSGVITSNYLLVPDYWNNCVYRINRDTGVTVQRIAVHRPYSVAYKNVNSTLVPYISSTDTSTVVVLDPDTFDITNTITLNAYHPKGMVTDANNDVWTANYDSDCLTRISGNTTLNIVVGRGPLHIAANAVHVLVTNSLSDEISAINVNTLAVTTFASGGQAPISIAVDANKIYVCNIASANICVFDNATFALEATYSKIGVNPTFLYVVGNELFVSDPELSQVFRLDKTNGSIVDQYSIPAHASEFLFADTFLYISSKYASYPGRTLPRDITVEAPTFEDIIDAAVLKPALTNTIYAHNINSIVYCSIAPTAYTVEFLKNGISAGRNTTVVEGDSLVVAFTTPFEFDTTYTIYVSVGHHVQELSVTTEKDFTTALPFTYASVIGASRSTVYESEEELIDGIAVPTIDAEAYNGFIVKNNGANTSNTTATNTDELSISLTTSSEFQTTTTAILTLGPVQIPFVVQTSLDPNLKFLSNDFKFLLPVEMSAGFAGPSDSYLLATNTVTDEIIETSLDTFPAIPDPDEFNNDLDYLMLIDAYGDRVMRVGMDGAVVQQISVPKPFDVAIGPTATDNPALRRLVFVSSYTTNTVKVIDKQSWTVIGSIDVGQKPSGIVGGFSNLDNQFLVCCYTASVVQVWTYTYANTATLQTTITLPTNAGPIYIVASSEADYYWVSLSRLNKVARIRASDFHIDYFDTGAIPWHITLTNDYVFVTNAYANTITWLKASDGSLISEFATGSTIPIYTSVYESDTQKLLYVTHHESYQDTIEVYDYTNESGIVKVDSITPVDKRLMYGSYISADNQLLLSLRQYPTEVTKLSPPVYHVPLDLDPIVNVTKGQVVNSDVTIVKDLIANQNIEISIPDLYDAVIVKNNVDVGTSTTLRNGDEFYIQVPTLLDYYYRYNIPIIFTNYIYDWYVQTEPDLIPSSAQFIDKFNLYLSEIGYSNVITISGLTAHVEAPATVVRGTGVLLNGIDITETDPELTATEFFVMNGDTVQLYGNPGSPYGTAREHVLTVGITNCVFKAWTIFLDAAKRKDASYAIATNMRRLPAVAYNASVGYSSDTAVVATNSFGVISDKYTQALQDVERSYDSANIAITEVIAFGVTETKMFTDLVAYSVLPDKVMQDTTTSGSTSITQRLDTRSFTGTSLVQDLDDSSFVPSRLEQHYDDTQFSSTHQTLQQDSTEFVSTKLEQHFDDAAYIATVLEQHTDDATYVSSKLEQHYDSSIYLNSTIEKHTSSSTYISNKLEQHYYDSVYVKPVLVKYFDTSDYVNISIAKVFEDITYFKTELEQQLIDIVYVRPKQWDYLYSYAYGVTYKTNALYDNDYTTIEASIQYVDAGYTQRTNLTYSYSFDTVAQEHLSINYMLFGITLFSPQEVFEDQTIIPNYVNSVIDDVIYIQSKLEQHYDYAVYVYSKVEQHYEDAEYLHSKYEQHYYDTTVKYSGYVQRYSQPASYIFSFLTARNDINSHVQHNYSRSFDSVAKHSTYSVTKISLIQFNEVSMARTLALTDSVFSEIFANTAAYFNFTSSKDTALVTLGQRPNPIPFVNTAKYATITASVINLPAYYIQSTIRKTTQLSRYVDAKYGLLRAAIKLDDISFKHNTDIEYDNTPLYTAQDKYYYTSQALAEQAALNAGYVIQEILTFELHPNSWVWAYRVGTNVNSCESLPYKRVRGWIRGG